MSLSAKYKSSGSWDIKNGRNSSVPSRLETLTTVNNCHSCTHKNNYILVLSCHLPTTHHCILSFENKNYGREILHFILKIPILQFQQVKKITLKQINIFFKLLLPKWHAYNFRMKHLSLDLFFTLPFLLFSLSQFHFHFRIFGVFLFMRIK